MTDRTKRLVLKGAAPAVSLEDMKFHLRVDTDDDDDLIEAVTSAAEDDVSKEIGRALVDQEWEMKLSCFDDCIELPFPPLLEITSFKYLDEDSVEQDVDASLYDVIGGEVGAEGKAHIIRRSGESWPDHHQEVAQPITIRFRAGYVDMSVSPAEGEIPGPIIAAIKLTAGDLYANRERQITGTIVSQVPGVERLLKHYRVYD